MREALLAVVLVTAGLAGCIGSEDAPVDAANATDTAAEGAATASGPTFSNGTAAPEILEVRDCYEHFALFPVPASAYQDRLPEGFSLIPYLGEPTGSSATLSVWGQTCDLPDQGSVTRAVTSLAVDPPDALEHPDEEAFHDLVLSWVTTSEHRARVNGAWGFRDVVETGEVSMDETETPTARRGTLEVAAGDADVHLETVVGGQPSEGDPGKLRLFALGAEGTVTGAKDLHWTSSTGLTGTGAASGSAGAGMPETLPAGTGLGFQFWGWSETETYVDLPALEDGNRDGSPNTLDADRDEEVRRWR